MHRPRSTAEDTRSARLWLRAHGARSLVLAALYFIFGHASFLVRVDDILVTPVLFAPEGIALAMVLRFGAALWPGVFAGQFALALSRGLGLWPSASISAINSLEAVLAVWLFRSLKLDSGLPRARDLAGLLLLVFFVLQPFSATLGNATLWAAGIVTGTSDLVTSWTNWWIGNALGQMLIAPLLLTLFAGLRGKAQAAGDFLVPLLVLVPALLAASYLTQHTGISSLVVVFAPLLILLAIYRGMVAVCVGGLIVALGALYATSRAFGPFVTAGAANIPDLNLFIIGLTMSGQFLATFLRQLRNQRQLEDELRASREAMQRVAFELTENIPVGTYTMVQQPGGGPANFSFMSARFLELTGLEREAARENPMNAFACVHPDDREEWVRKNAHVFEHKLPFKEECRVIVKGETRWISAESTPRHTPDGCVVWEGVLIDITDRKKAQEEIATASRNMRLAASAARLGFWEYDMETKLAHWDEEMARIHGIKLADFDGRWEKYVHPEDYEEVMMKVRQILEKEKSFEIGWRIVRPDGEIRHIHEHGLVLRDSLGRAVGARGVMRDITDEKEAAARERQMEEEHRRDLENKLKTSLTASAVAHEINQPLSSIILQSQMALENDDDARGALRLIADDAQRVVVTIDKMKTLLRNVQTEHREVDLAEVTQSALRYNKSLISRHRIQLLTTGLDRHIRIMGDGSQLQLALTNLIRNAAEAIAEAKMKKREIAVELAVRDNDVELIIGDSGPGWPGEGPSEVPLSTTKKSGTGIGLYVVRTTMENHRGEIIFGQSPLGGAEVRLRFPRAQEKS